MIHVAILKPGYLRAILDGTKTIESRLTKTMQPPHGKVQPGERLFLKASGGPFMATALAGKVLSHQDLTPRGIDKMRRKYNKPIGGDEAYWEMKRESRFATLIELNEVEPISVGPKYKVAYMKAWYVLDEAISPLRDWTITPGAIRNRYACLPASEKSTMQPGKPITLDLPDGQVIHTELARSRMLRWRGWGPVYESASAKAGDKLRFIATGPGHFSVYVSHQR